MSDGRCCSGGGRVSLWRRSWWWRRRSWWWSGCGGGGGSCSGWWLAASRKLAFSQTAHLARAVDLLVLGRLVLHVLGHADRVLRAKAHGVVGGWGGGVVRPRPIGRNSHVAASSVSAKNGPAIGPAPPTMRRASSTLRRSVSCRPRSQRPTRWRLGLLPAIARHADAVSTARGLTTPRVAGLTAAGVNATATESMAATTAVKNFIVQACVSSYKELKLVAACEATSG